MVHDVTISILLFICILILLLKQIECIKIVGGDSITHYLIHRMYRNKENYLKCGTYGEKKLRISSKYHKLTSLFLRSYPSNDVIYFNFFVKILSTLLIFTYVTLNSNYQNAIYSSLFFLSLPFNLSCDWEMSSLVKYGERYIALLVIGLQYYILTIVSVEYNFYIALIMAFTVYLSLCLGKFSTQALLINTMLFYFFNDINYQVILAFIIPILIYIINNENRKEIISHYLHLKNFNKYHKSTLMVNKGAFLKNVITKFGRMYNISGKFVVYHISLVVVIINLDDIYQGLPILLSSLLISTPWLFRIGQGYRYLLYSGSIFLSVSVSSLNYSYLLIILNIFICIYIFYKNKPKWIKQKDKVNELYDIVNNIIRGDESISTPHYKDGEILALKYKKLKVSTSRSYLWDEVSMTHFEKYPICNSNKDYLTKMGYDFRINNIKDINNIQKGNCINKSQNYCMFKIC